ncbi:MAG: hypothetical protein M3R25_11650 [Bacteroidota bacterium]|nr:hypothetical protein [Bacteroidota bacterium]
MENTPDQPQYIAGRCNLGQEEIQRRWRIGYLGTAASFFLILLIELGNLPSWTRLLIFVPVYYALSGYLQARQKFCYVYGWKGVFSITGKKHFKHVNDADARRKDNQLVYNIVAKILIGSIMITALYYFLPHIN